MMKAIIIGAGIIGSAVAFQLSKRGVEVTILDAGSPGDAASAASLAWTNSNNKQLREYHDLSTMSMMEWHLLARELGNDSWLQQVGNLNVADTEAGSDMLKERVSRLNSLGYAAIPYNPKDIQRLDTSVRVQEDYLFAAYFPAEGYISTNLLIQQLLLESKRLGARTSFQKKVSSLSVQNNQVTGVILEDGSKLDADIVISAAGAGLSDLLEHLGVNVRTAGTPGASITTSAGASNLSTVLHLPALSLRPDSDGRIVVRSKLTDQRIDQNLQLSDESITELLTHASQSLTDFDASSVTAERVKVASRPYLFDGLPVVGHWEDLSGLYVMTMHSGVTLAAIVSRLAAEEIVTNTEFDLLKNFRPDRVIKASVEGADYFDPYSLEGEAQ